DQRSVRPSHRRRVLCDGRARPRRPAHRHLAPDRGHLARGRPQPGHRAECARGDGPRRRGDMTGGRLPAAVILAVGALLTFTGCSGGVGMPMPSATPTVTPDADPGTPVDADIDPRCEAGYGDPRRVLESEHEVRPLGWPQTPPFAVLCVLEPL